MKHKELIWHEGKWQEGHFPFVSSSMRRASLARFYRESGYKRAAWEKHAPFKKTDLPTILSTGFLRMYAEAEPLTVELAHAIMQEEEAPHDAISVGETEESSLFFDVKATPPGILPKFFPSYRLLKDPELLNQVQKDLDRVFEIKEPQKRRELTLAILSHGASYRELDGKVLRIPSLVGQEQIPYAFRHHLLWEGVKTVSASPLEREEKEPGLYLCQGTEIWPSQPLMLGSIIANLGKEGSATEPYAYSWKLIHKHLRALSKGVLPIVAGHSMGGALALQIALYSHPLIDTAYAFNSPMPESRDEEVYRKLPSKVKQKLQVYASIDDLPFWRIGSYLIGEITLFLGERRRKYYSIRKRDLIFFFPALVKAFLNLRTVRFSHQDIVPLQPSYISLKLSEEEKERENRERVLRFDHIHFFSRFYSPAMQLLSFVRRHFTWSKLEEYLQHQLEVIELHEADLLETQTIEGGGGIAKQLEELRLQKKEVIERLKKRIKDKG